MLSKTDSNGGISGNEKPVNDLEIISKVLYEDKTISGLPSSVASSGSNSVRNSQLPQPKPKNVKDDKKDPFDEEKKPSIWSWKRLKALTGSRSRKINCCFSLLVHSIEGLPPVFDGVCMVVHWKRRDIEQTTRPIRIYQGVADFDEQLTHTCSINGSRSGTNKLAKYEAKHFLLYASVYDAPEHDFGRHRMDLTRLLPLTLEELEEDRSSGKWTTSFRLSGEARGATLNVSFGYVIIGNNNIQPCPNDNGTENLRLRQSSAKTEIFLDQLDHKNGLTICRVASLPARLTQSTEEIRDLHEVLPSPTSELRESVNVLYQKLDEMSSPSVKNQLDAGPFPSHDDPQKLISFNPPDSDEKIYETDWEVSEFSVVEKGTEEFPKEQVRSEQYSLKVDQASGEALETDGNAVVEVPHNKDDAFHASAEEIHFLRDEGLMSTSNFTEKKNESFSKESLMKELEIALSYTSDLINEGLIDSQDDESEVLHHETSLDTNFHFGFHRNGESLCLDDVTGSVETARSYASDLLNEGLVDSQDDESEDLHQESSMDINSHVGDQRKGESLCLDDDPDLVAGEFLNMLGIEQEHSPLGLSSESEPDSPRERLLKQFEKDVLANGGFLNFDTDNDPEEFVNDIPMGSIWQPISSDFHQSSICKGFQEIPKLETDALTTKARASRLEDLETEALMRDWGINEKAFQYSPSRGSAGFGSPVDLPPEDLEKLPPLVEGLGPFMKTKNGGFLRSMNPALFRNAKSGGSLIMQVSSPVVVPAEMGSGVMDILQGLAAMGIEKLSMQANKLMPLEDITGKTIQQIAWEAAPDMERPKRQSSLQQESEIMQNILTAPKSGKEISSGSKLDKSASALFGSDVEYVSLEDLAPLAMDKIEALSVEGLRIQSGMSDEDAPSNISTQSIGEFSALKGKTLGVGGSIGLSGTGGLQLLDIKDKCEDVDELMGLSLTLDEWVKLDSGDIDDDDLLSERTSRVLAAHHATSLDLFRRRSNGEKRRGRARKYGLLGNCFTVALMVQLRDPLRNYEPVGTPMLGLIQVERVFVPPRPKIYSAVPIVRNNSEDEEEPTATRNKNIIENPIEKKMYEELIPQYKITEVHIAGLKTESVKKKLWGSTNQRQSGSRWLLANGMGKKNKHPLMKSKVVVKNSGPTSMTTTVQPGDTLWSISCRVHGTGTKWKELATLNPHIRNPNVILTNGTTIRLS